MKRRMIQDTTQPTEKITKSPPEPDADQMLQIFDSAAWTHIYSYLTLSNLEAVVRGNPKLKQNVKTYLRVGHKLVIDQNTLWQYPVSDNNDLYSKYGSLATNIEFQRLLAYEMESLIPLFPKVQELTLRDVRSPIHYRDQCYFNSLRKLTLIGRSDDRDHSPPPLMCQEPIQLPCLMHLRSLTLIRVTLDECWCHPLESLTIDNCWSAIPFDYLKVLYSIEHLRVLGSVDWKQKEQITALGVETFEVGHYLSIPTEENLILKLNDDCLLYLQKFLSSQDWISLHETHPRFQHLRIARYTSDEGTRKGRPVDTHDNFYKRIGPLVSSLHFRTEYVSDLEATMPYFSNLSQLRLTFLENYKDQIFNIPDGLCEFRDMFRGLNATLRVLHLEYVSCEYDDRFKTYGLKELTNIKEFHCRKVDACEELLEFLEANQDTMQTLSFEGECDDPNQLLRVISGMRNLKSLELHCGFKWCDPLSIPKGSQPLLEILSISASTEAESKAMNELLALLDLSQLKKFRWSGRRRAPSDIWPRMSNLLELNIWDMELVPTVFVLTKLQRLKTDFRSERALDLIKGLPELTVLDNNSREVEEASATRIRQYLKENKRTLWLNKNRLE